MSLDKLKTAIAARFPVQFEYEDPSGERVGNPHAVFIFRRKDGTESTKVHIEQTAGVSKSKDAKPFPSFRMFDLEKLAVTSIRTEDGPFDISEEYNPEWEGYQFVIIKV